MKIERPKEHQPIPPHAKKVFGGIVFDVYQWEQELFDGTTATFEKIKRRDTAVVYPVLEDGTILVVEQSQPNKPSYISGAGGKIEDGEDVLEAAKRELLEETGYVAEEFALLHASHTMAKTDYVVYHFIAKGCKKVAEQSLDAGEKIKIMPVTFDEFLQLARNERFIEKDIIPMLYEALLDPVKKEELRKKFSV